MAAEEDDVYDGDYDFVDDEGDDEVDAAAVDEEDSADEPADDDDAPARGGDDRDGEPGDEPVEALDRPAPLANYVVHIYEYRKFKRTIDRPFAAEEAEAFASEYNRTAKPYARFALAGKDDAKPRKTLD
jgi:hypothetical protein